jgi:FtsH-binding integral membrane protein
MENFTSTFGNSVADALPEERAAFIRKTYAHLAGAVLLFILLESYLVISGAGLRMAQTMVGGRYSWLIVLLAFMGAATLANWWANSSTSRPLQYMGLLLYVLVETILFLPLLFMATMRSGGGEILIQSGIITAGLFAGLTAVVFLSRRDFSFLAPILAVAFFVSLGFIVASIIYGFSLGTLFSYLMVAFAGGAILYQTSNILHHYRTDQHVAASLSLFASVALLYWYIVRIFMSSRN